jgi:hypothetical protein
MKAIYLLFFVFVFAPPLFAYIDPGTGSMLFSLLTGIAVTAFFFLKNLLIKVKGGLFIKGTAVKQAERHRLVIYSEGKQYWNVFEPIVRELAARHIPCVYYTSGEDDPGLAFTSPHIQARCIGTGNTAYRFLNFLEADVCLMTTPGLDVLQLKRSPAVRRYVHILHTVTDATTYRLFGIDYYDGVLLTGEYQKRDIRALEQKRSLKEKSLWTVGCIYLDSLYERLNAGQLSHREAAKTVLVAPSWGANGILRRYGLALLEPLAQSSYRVIIRPHPQSALVERDTIERLRASLASYQNVEWNFDAENLTALSRADILISDFSGVVFDYAFLFNRPVVYPAFTFDKRPYDMADIAEEAWTFRAIRDIGFALNEADFAGIGRFLEKIPATDSAYIEKIRRLKDEAWMHCGEAGKRAVDVLVELMES